MRGTFTRVGTAIVVVAVQLAIPASRIRAQVPRALFSEDRADAGVAPGAAPNNPMVRRRRAATLNLEMLQAPGVAASGWAAAAAPPPARSVVLNLFSDVTVVAILDHVETIAALNGTAWVGTVAGEEDSQVFLSASEGVFTGSVSYADRWFSIHPLREQIYVIDEVNVGALPPDDVEPLRPDLPVLDAVSEVIAADSGDTFDVLLYYTTAAKNAAGGPGGIDAQLTNTVVQMNSVYAASGISARMRVVGAIEMSYRETGSLSTDLGALRSNATVRETRNRLGADFVSLVVNESDPNASGVGYVMAGVNPSFEGSAFTVVTYYSFLPFIRSLIHEMGHNMGCLHEPGNNGSSDSGGAFPYSLGYTDFTGKFHDIMSYGNNCTGCPRINQFSSPGTTYQGRPAGTATQDNARSINNVRTTVANFRQTVSTYVGSPAGLSASAAGSTVSLTWRAPASGTPTSYIIQAGSSSGTANLADFSTGSRTTTFSASGIANGLYYLRVLATDGVTVGPASNEAILQVGVCSSAPSAPTGLTASVAASAVFLQWYPTARATTYVLEAGSAPGSSNLVVSDLAGSFTEMSSDLGPLVGFTATAGGGPYYVRMRARNACGTSAASNEVVVTFR
jgi:hypothetical protein